MVFKLDTGAAVTAIPASLKHCVPNIMKSNKILKGAGNNNLTVLGYAEVTISNNKSTIKENVYVVDNLTTPLLGKPAITNLGLISFVDSVGTTQKDWFLSYPNLFKGLGTMDNEVKIILDNKVSPFVQCTPRRIAAARRQPLRDELERMEKLGVIEKIEEPTEWCAPCIVVPKKENKIRVCIDFTQLNKAVKREFHPLPNSEETMSELGNSRVFSKLDANCGYWQMKLDKKYQKLTTFITPFGRYYCKRLPFGISSAPEIFQREMQKILIDLEGIVCQMDDILVHGSSMEQHDERLNRVLERLQKAGVTLNESKCEFARTEVKFLGHIINSQGIHADPEKTKAIKDFPTPTNKKELRRFFGMVNYLGKFSPQIASTSESLRQLLGKRCDWLWGSDQIAQFKQLKDLLSATPVLTPFKLDSDSMITADSSSYGLGAALLQKVDEQWKPVAYASRVLTAAERRYAQIEKEALAICWACDKFAGKRILIETDHRPLLSILGEKELAKLPLRVQRFRLRMMNYSYDIIYTPGSKLLLADALSRSPIKHRREDLSELKDSSFVKELMNSLPISETRLERIKAATLMDDVALLLHKYTCDGWPQAKQVPDLVRSYYAFRDHVTVVDNILFYQGRVFIPEMERERVLKDIHRGHQGETKCIRRASKVVWWPGMTLEIRELVKKCGICEERRIKPKEPLICTPLPERPWWRLAVDLFEFSQKSYVVVVDYYSRYISVHELLDSSDSNAVIKKLEGLFTMLGIPNTIVSDNGPQFVSDAFKQFLRKWDIQHVTSAPKSPQSNGEAERAVQTVKGLMHKNVNLQAALCVYRDTPLANGFSPAELLFNRPMNSMGIMTDSKIDVNRLRKFESQQRRTQALQYNQRHAARSRSPIKIGEKVIVRDQGKPPVPASVVATRGREVVVASESTNLLRRNRSHISRAAKSSVSNNDGNLTRETESFPEISPTQNDPVVESNQSAPSPVVQTPEETNSDTRVNISTPHVVVPNRRSRRNRESAPVTLTNRQTRSGRISKPPDKLNL